MRGIPFAHLIAFWISVYAQKSDAFSAIAPTIGAGRPYTIYTTYTDNTVRIYSRRCVQTVDEGRKEREESRGETHPIETRNAFLPPCLH